MQQITPTGKNILYSAKFHKILQNTSSNKKYSKEQLQ